MSNDLDLDRQLQICTWVQKVDPHEIGAWGRDGGELEWSSFAAAKIAILRINGMTSIPRVRCRISWSGRVITAVGPPTRGESSDTGRSARSQGFRTVRDDAMRAESFQGRRRLCHFTDSYVISKANSPAVCHATHPPSTHRALLHGIGTQLLTGTATHPPTTLPKSQCWAGA